MKKQVKRKATPKLRAIQTSRHFGLVHARHSGKLVHKRNTSYPALAMIVLCVGVFMIGCTQVVKADPVDMGGYAVSARVAGEAPTEPAVITSPASGYTSKERPVNVEGTCPISTYVQLFRNNFPSGISLCDSSGKFSITTDLFDGQNVLVTRVYNLADTQGPDSSPVTITYTAPVTSITPISSSPTTAPQVSGPNAIPPILLKSSFVYRGSYTGEAVTFSVVINGGEKPYAVAVDWGDGTRSLYSRTDEGEFTIEHKYKRAGFFKGSYKVLVTASDSNDQETVLQLIAIVNDLPEVSGTTTNSRSNGLSDSIFGGPFSYFSEISTVALQSYGVLVLMVSSFWLGEVRELGKVRLRHTHRRHK